MYVLGVDEPISEFEGKLFTIITRGDDIENKWVVCPCDVILTIEEIKEAIFFQEKYFDSKIQLL